MPPKPIYTNFTGLVNSFLGHLRNRLDTAFSGVFSGDVESIYNYYKHFA